MKLRMCFVFFVCLAATSEFCVHACALTVREYFGLGKYENEKRIWSAQTYDGTVEATFDDEGENVGANRYSAFGNRISSVENDSNREAFQGGDYRPNADQYNLGFRNMTDADGLWLEPEPMLVLGLEVDRLHDPLQFNPYRYARNNPVILTDPSGYAYVPVYSTKLDRFLYGAYAMACAGALKNVSDDVAIADVLESRGEWLLAGGFQMKQLIDLSQAEIVCPGDYNTWLVERRASESVMLGMPSPMGGVSVVRAFERWRMADFQRFFSGVMNAGEVKTGSQYAGRALTFIEKDGTSVVIQFSNDGENIFLGVFTSQNKPPASATANALTGFARNCIQRYGQYWRDINPQNVWVSIYGEGQALTPVIQFASGGTN